MGRIPFSQRLKNAVVNILDEYVRLYDLFYNQKIRYGSGGYITLHFFCDHSFLKLPEHLRGTCISLEDFDGTNGFYFEECPYDINPDYLLDFCEYTYNLVYFSKVSNPGMIIQNLDDAIQKYILQITAVIEKIGYMQSVQDDLFIFVPKDQVVKTVAEIVDKNLSYKLIEYNHRSLKGNVEKKRAILLVLADQLEPYQVQLRDFTETLAKDLFFLLNNVNVRHNNIDQNGTKYIPYVANMKKEEIEQWYDTIYHLCLTAFLELEHLDHKDKIDQLKQNIHPKKS